MLKSAVVALALTLTSSLSVAEVTGVAPNFTLPGIAQSVSLSDYKGQVVYLDFWASWCGPCRDSFPWMNKMQSKYQQQGVKFIAINVDRTSEAAQTFLSQNPAHFTIAFDAKGETPKQYDILGMPTAFVIGRDGQILHNHIGFNTDEMADYEQSIQDALKENH